MKFYNKENNSLIMLFVVTFGFLFSFKIYASDCGVLSLQDTKSSGVFIKENNCSKLPSVSRGAVFKLSPRGRLWLKSKPSKSIASDFQLICQNRTGDNIDVEFSDMISPWLSASKLMNCSRWVNNRLTCEGNKGEKNGMYCILAFIKLKDDKSSNYVERTTSIKMRNLKTSPGSNPADLTIDKDLILETIKPDLQLCKKLNQVSHAIDVQWSVGPGNTVEKVKVARAGNNDLFACVEAVVSSFIFPYFPVKVSFNSTF